MKSYKSDQIDKLRMLSKTSLKEDFLHYIWKFKLFQVDQLKTVRHKKIRLLKAGQHNKASGPDFFNGLIEIEGLQWAGNIEMHLKSSDWYAHHHEIDPNYDSVILHVVWEYDVPVFYSNQKEIPTIQLVDYVNLSVLESYYKLFSAKQKWILCEDTIGEIDPFILEAWLNRLYFERLEKKAQKILHLLKQTNNDWEAVLFQLLSKSFGMKLNGETFLDLAKSFDFSVLRKCQQKKGLIEVLLMGQAGFFNDSFEDITYITMKKEYVYLQNKFNLTPMFKGQFQFFRLRPSNFPTLRISQLSNLYENHQNIFSKIIKMNDIHKMHQLFSLKASVYWENHYVFGKESEKRVKGTSNSFTDLIVLNVIIPLKYTYQKYHNKTVTSDLESLIRSIKPESNSVLDKYDKLGIQVKSAFDSQGLLELQSSYCKPKRCLDCTIGLQILKKKQL
ncbi:DUF2851 family protein [Flavicella sp.]|uniref:DUF2851 family protein n=1 Tax=Flavicella sp. TaxID=2957742 RepID=UPI0030167336